MKVLMVCTVPTERSGIPNVIVNLMGGLTLQTINDIKLGYVSINNPDNSFTDKLTVWGIDNYVVERKISHLLGYVRRLSRIAKDYDVMHAHGNSATIVLEMIAAKIAGVPIRIAHSHNTTCRLKCIDKMIRPLFYKLCNGRIACGKEAGEWLFGNQNFMILNNGIDSDKFKFDLGKRDEIRGKLNVGNSIMLGHIGNFVSQKNHSFLIDVFYEFHKINPNSKLLLLGDGPLREIIKNRVNFLDIANSVIFIGSVSNPEYYMNAMDMIIMPSLFEGLPLSMIEEQCNGLPILASDKISADSNLTGLVKFKSLKDSATDWAKEAINIVSINIRNKEVSDAAMGKIKKCGYSIKESASQLKNYYIEKLQSNARRNNNNPD